MSHYLTLLLCTLALVAGCSRNPERSSAGSPTAPSAAAPGSLLGASSVAPGGVSGPMDVSFPGRNDSFAFRNSLEGKYRDGLRRGGSPTTVDIEGEVVWTQEYIRYRVNGCDHGTALQRVMTQIDGNAAGGVCGAPPDGLVLFPGRGDSFEFRNSLESKYGAMGRGQNPLFADREGGVIWTQEYLRYRVNACDHTTSVDKVFSQIDGGGVAATCFVQPCLYGISPSSQTVPAAGGTFTVTVTKISSGCTYSSDVLASFVSITGGGTGSDTGTLTYTVAPNTGNARSGQIRVRWTNGSTLLDINQAGAALATAFTMSDPFRGTGTGTSCHIRSTATPCVFAATSNVTSATATFAWTATYLYGATTITKTQTSTSPNFTFTEQCNGAGSTAEGADSALNVTVTVTDPSGTDTVTSGSGSQPVLTIKLFTC
ncbi:MAG: hypothetical protein Q7R30_05755 [Acidobacteriota bacterium]|nr:hypothetical protein [Acidobacteriota bacterium]